MECADENSADFVEFEFTVLGEVCTLPRTSRFSTRSNLSGKRKMKSEAARTPFGDKELEQVTCESDAKPDKNHELLRIESENGAKDREAETKATAATAVALHTKAHAAFEGQSSDLIGNIDALKEAIAVLHKGMMGGRFSKNGEIVGFLKRLKGEMSSDLSALEKEGLDRKTIHQDLVKAEAQPWPAKAPPWRDQVAARHPS